MNEIIKQLNNEEYLEHIKRWKKENKDLIESCKCKKTFTECLPKIKYGNKNIIDLKNIVGYNVYFIYEDIESYIDIIKYNKETKKVTLKFEDRIKEMLYSEFNLGRIGNIVGKKTKDFKYKIGQIINDDKRNITIVDRKYEIIKGIKYKLYKYKCNKCEFDCGEHYSMKENKYYEEYWIRENNLNKGNGCSCCSSPSKIVVEGINDIPTTAPWMVKYFQSGYDEAKKYTYQSNKRIYAICPDCNSSKNIIINDIYNLHSIGCKCSDGVSFPEKFMFNILNQLKTNNQLNVIEIEKKFNWCKYYNKYKNKESFGRYDFVIEDKKIIIETDGNFHRRDNEISGQTKEESQYIDNIKDKLAKKNGYKVIRISDKGNIKQNIMNSDLNNIFNLSIINWDKCYEFAFNNLIKIASQYKKNNPNLTTTKIGKLMGGYCKSTIQTWLKQGSKLNWCDYNGKEEQIKLHKVKNNSSSKQIKIFKENILLGIFFSVNELERCSKNLFNIKLLNKSISSVCRGEQKTHKGFTFKYISKDEYNSLIDNPTDTYKIFDAYYELYPNSIKNQKEKIEQAS